MATNMRGSGSDDFDAASLKQVLLEILGTQKNVKEVNSTSIDIKIKDSVRNSTEEMQKLNYELKDYNKLISEKPRKYNSMSKYFVSDEKAINEINKAYNQFVSDVNSKKADMNNLGASNSAKEVLKWTNALEALRGDKSYVNDLNSEVINLVKTMRNMPNFGENYNLSPKQFVEYFNILNKLKGSLSDISDFMPKGWKFDIDDKDIVELLSLTNETKSAVQGLGEELNTSLDSNTGTMDGAIADQKAYQEELQKTQKIAHVTQSDMLELINSKDKVHVDEFDMFDSTDLSDSLNEIQKYDIALEQLRKKQQSALESAINYKNQAIDVQNGDREGKYDYQEWADDYIQDYQKYAAQIELIETKLHESIQNFVPTDGNGMDTQSIQVLLDLLKSINNELIEVKESFSQIKSADGLDQVATDAKEMTSQFNLSEEQVQQITNAFQILSNELSTISKAFGSIDDDNGFSPLLSSVNQINEALGVTSQQITELTSAISGINFNISFGGNKSVAQKSAEFGDQEFERLKDLRKAFDALSEVSGGQIFRGLGKNLSDFTKVTESMGSSDSTAKQIRDYKELIAIMKTAAQQKGIDLTSWSAEFEKPVERAVEEAKKITSEENNAVNSLGKIFGTNNTINFDGVSEQLNAIISDLEKISSIVSNGLNLKQSLDMGDNSEEAKSETQNISTLEQTVNNVTEAIGRKNQAFKDEASIVATSTDEEIAELENLINWINTIQRQLETLSHTPVVLDITKNEKVNTGSIDVQSGVESVNSETSIAIKKNTKEWNEAAKAAKTYKDILGDTYNVVQKIRTDKDGKKLISYQYTGKNGNSVTIGENGKLISSTNKVSDALDRQKISERELTAEEKKHAQSAKEQADYEANVIKEKEAADKEYVQWWNKSLKEQEAAAEANMKAQIASQNKINSLKQDVVTSKNPVTKAKKEEDLVAEQEILSKLQEEGKQYTSIISLEEQRRRLVEETAASKSKLDKVTDVADATRIEQVNAALAKTAATMNQLKVANNSEAFGKEYASTATQIEKLNEKLRKDGNVTSYNKEITKLTNSLTKMKNIIMKVNLNDITSAQQAMTAYALNESQGKAEVSSFKGGETIDQAKELTYEWKDQDNWVHKLTLSYDELTGAVSKTGASQKQVNETTRSWTEQLKHAWENVARYVSSFISFYAIIDVVKQGISAITQLDSAMTEMRKVSDETVSSLQNFQKESFGIGNTVGTTALQIQQSTADWMRLGETLDDAKKSAADSNVLLNVSEFDNIDDATTSLVSMSQAYKDLDKMDIIDKLNNIGNNYSIGTDGIATALQRSASSLTTAGNDINEAISLITAGNAIVQDPDSVGAGIRTIALRLTGTKEAKQTLTDLGEDTDGVITTVSKLRDTIMSATAVASNGFKGFDILDENGNYKSTYEILQGIADVYDQIIETDKKTGSNNVNLLLETLAGKNRSNIAASILQNGDMLKSVYADSQNSQGSATDELNKYLDSIEGRLQEFKNQVQEFWYDFISAKTVKGVVSFGTDLINLLDQLIGKAGVLKTSFMAVGAVMTIKNKGGGRVRILYCKL